MRLAELVAWLIVSYAACGALFATAFVPFGVDRVDATAKTLGFRLLIVPGAVALWPLMLSRWIAKH